MREFMGVVDAIRASLGEKDPALETMRPKLGKVPPQYQAHTILDGYEYMILMVPTAQAGGILTGAKAAGAEPVPPADAEGTD